MRRRNSGTTTLLQRCFVSTLLHQPKCAHEGKIQQIFKTSVWEDKKTFLEFFQRPSPLPAKRGPLSAQRSGLFTATLSEKNFSATRPRLFKLPKTLVSIAKSDRDMVFLDPFDVTLYTMFGQKKAASGRLRTLILSTSRFGTFSYKAAVGGKVNPFGASCPFGAHFWAPKMGPPYCIIPPSNAPKKLFGGLAGPGAHATFQATENDAFHCGVTFGRHNR